VAVLTEQRFKQAEFAAWVGIAGDIALAVLNAFVGVKANSKALLANAVHLACSAAGSITLLIGLKAFKMAPDENNPSQHGKTASIIVSVLLLMVGIQIGISAVKTLWTGVHTPPQSYALIAVGISIVVKEIIFRYQRNSGQQIGTQAVKAHAWEQRSGVYSSIAAFTGMVGALLGTYMEIPFFYYFDPGAALLVSLFVLRMGFHLVMQAIQHTGDSDLHEEDAAELLSTVQRVKGVITVDDLRVREQGHYVIVEMKITVNPKISVLEGHDIARAAKQQLMKQFIHVSDVLVHVNPYDPGYPYKHNMDLEQDDFPTLVH
jgi:cation diffusion facilitator family transporter